MEIKTQELLEVYDKAIKLNLENGFIAIIEYELIQRGVLLKEKVS